MARVRVQRKTGRREPPSVYCFAVSLETRLTKWTNLCMKQSETILHQSAGAILMRCLLDIGRGVACRCSYTAKTEAKLWVSCCKRFIGIVPKRKIASINGGPLSNQNSR